MRLDICLNYPGNCEDAFRFYEHHLAERSQEWAAPMELHIVINSTGTTDGCLLWRP
jgi:hypothetical protein